MLLFALIGFVFVGLALGLLGGGGGILAFPVLVYLLGIPPRTAVPMALPVIGIAAATGAMVRWRRGELRVRTAAFFAIFSMGAAFLAPRLGSTLPDRARILLSVTTMLLAAGAMWLRSRQIRGSAAAGNAAEPSLLRVVPAAVVVGSLTGLIGVGGGFLIVPALTGVLGMPMVEATAASLALIALNSASAGLSYWGQVSVDPILVAEITGAALVGMVIGTRIAPRFSSRILTRSFVVLLVLISVFTLWREYGV